MIDWDEKRTCPQCGKEVTRGDMDWSYDCHGIKYRLLCHDCLEKIDGYDGRYYDEMDAGERIEDDY